MECLSHTCRIVKSYNQLLSKNDFTAEPQRSQRSEQKKTKCVGESVRIRDDGHACRHRGCSAFFMLWKRRLHHELDLGPYIDMIPTMRDTHIGAYNACLQRTMFKGLRKLGIHMSPRHPHHWGDPEGRGSFREDQGYRVGDSTFDWYSIQNRVYWSTSIEWLRIYMP